MILAARKPVVYVGGGVVLPNSSDELMKFAELVQAPVTTTLMAMSSFPKKHPLSLGMLGMHGTYYAKVIRNRFFDSRCCRYCQGHFCADFMVSNDKHHHGVAPWWSH